MPRSNKGYEGGEHMEGSGFDMCSSAVKRMTWNVFWHLKITEREKKIFLLLFCFFELLWVKNIYHIDFAFLNNTQYTLGFPKKQRLFLWLFPQAIQEILK